MLTRVLYFQDPILNAKIEKYEEFIEDFGVWIHQIHSVDIIQAALQTPVGSYVYNAGVELARSKAEPEYFIIFSS